MATTKRTVRQLAKEAQVDTDTALVTLWEAGFEDLLDPKDAIGKRDLKRAKRSLGIATRGELKTHAYWMKLLNLNSHEFENLLKAAGVFCERKSKLDNKAILRLKAEARERGIDPITGIKYSPIVSNTPIVPTTTSTRPPSEWEIIGHARSLRWLSSDEVRSIHFELVTDFSSGPDPIDPPGIRSESLLESAIFRPKTALGGTLKYPTVEMSAAALLHSIILNHPFHNGNKRTALVCALVFLDENGLFPDFDENEAFRLVLLIAQHRVVETYQDNLSDREVLAISKWLCGHCRIVEKGERPISFRRLSRILSEYNCQIEVHAGSKATIIREMNSTSFFGRKKKPFRSDFAYGGEGREVPKKVIKKIREDLHLDDRHGTDSHSFYDQEPSSVSEFIARYRKTLDRLAKF